MFRLLIVSLMMCGACGVGDSGTEIRAIRLGAAATASVHAELPTGAKAMWLSGVDGETSSGTRLIRSGTHWLSSTVGGQQDLAFRLPLAVGQRLLSVAVHGRSGDGAGEVFAGILSQVDQFGDPTQIGATLVSDTLDGPDAIGWSIGDPGIGTDGVPITDAGPYILQVPIVPTSAVGDVAVYAIRLEYL